MIRDFRVQVKGLRFGGRGLRAREALNTDGDSAILESSFSGSCSGVYKVATKKEAYSLIYLPVRVMSPYSTGFQHCVSSQRS